MERLIKSRFRAIMVILLFFTFSAKVQTSHAQLLLTLESIAPVEPVIMNDTCDFRVEVGVTDIILLIPGIAIGDLFYWYRTDSMISSGQPARILELDLNVEIVVDNYVDTVPVDIRPNEIRTGPVNLIILWPAMINPLVWDTTGGTCFVTVEGFLGNDGNYPKQVGNVIFPCPALQYINIRAEELDGIKEISIISMEGQTIQTYQHDEFKNGSINMECYAAGTYIVQLTYYNNEVSRTKIQKQ